MDTSYGVAVVSGKGVAGAIEESVLPGGTGSPLKKQKAELGVHKQIWELWIGWASR